jgi:HPt (histidine-containing phosphotransfer) domain-containing protein
MPPARHDLVLTSEFATDPAMAELTIAFVNELPGRIDALQAAADAASIKTLIELTHQLKGAAGGYGYGPIGAAAGRIEHRLRTVGPHGSAAVSGVKQDLAELIELCRAALRGR